MTEPDLDEYGEPIYPDDDQTPEPAKGGRNWKALREKADKYDTEIGPLRNKLAFFEAGIPNTPHGQLLRDAYKGEPDTEAIRMFAAKYGVGFEDSGGSESEVPAAELEALDRADAASRGGSFTPPRPPDMNAAMRAAK